MDKLSGVTDIVNKLIDVTKNPEDFVCAQIHHVDDLKFCTKFLYDSGKCVEELTRNKIKSALSKLIIKNFNEEQIWQQIELQNKPSLSHLAKVISNLAKNPPVELKDTLPVDVPIEQCKKITIKSHKSNKMIEQKSKIKPHLVSASKVDDKFFKLSELEAFLNEEDKKEAKKSNESSDDEDEEDSIDYFASHTSDEDDEEKLKSGCEARYEDFFDMPDDEMLDDKNVNLDNQSNKESEDSEAKFDDLNDESGEESEGEQLDDDEEYDTRDVDDQELQDDKGSNVFREASDSEMEDDKEILNDDNNKDNNSKETLKSLLQQNDNKSTFQKRQEKLQQKIKELEEQQLAEKPWQLKGEITAAIRPENCLLEEHVKFDHVNRPPPVITEETTMKLEEIITQRIKDAAWDDVERKFKPPEHPFEYRQRILLDQEKSKISLAEVYEQEYLKKQKSEKEEEEETELPAHTEIKKFMFTLFTKLDALSNFRFKPRPPQPDIKVVSNLPALTVEEVAPVSVSDAMLLAPEEVKAKMKGEVKGKTERNITDRKRERRKKKLAQKMKSKRKEKLKHRSELGLDDKNSKRDALKKIKKRNVTIIKDSGKMDSALKSSKSFFSRLQEQTEISVSPKKKLKKKK